MPSLDMREKKVFGLVTWCFNVCQCTGLNNSHDGICHKCHGHPIKNGTILGFGKSRKSLGLMSSDIIALKGGEMVIIAVGSWFVSVTSN